MEVMGVGGGIYGVLCVDTDGVIVGFICVVLVYKLRDGSRDARVCGVCQCPRVKTIKCVWEIACLEPLMSGLAEGIRNGDDAKNRSVFPIPPTWPRSWWFC